MLIQHVVKSGQIKTCEDKKGKFGIYGSSPILRIFLTSQYKLHEHNSVDILQRKYRFKKKL